MNAKPARTITIRIPRLDFAAISGYLFSFINTLRSPRNLAFSRRLPSFGNPLKNINLKKAIPVVLVVAAAGLTIFGLGRLLGKIGKLQSDTTRISIAGAKATSQLNREFTFPLTGASGKTITEMKFFLETAELRDEIIIKGKRAIAIEGRTFLILTFKITSDYTRALEINTKNYFRLTRNGNDTDLLAADIHNDPVVVQPTSTKYTRIGWPINDTDKNLVLLVGEIEGEKTKVELGLQ